MEDSAGSTPPAIVMIVCKLIFVKVVLAIYRSDAPCGFYDRVCYQKYTPRQHLARLEESARGDSEGHRHHQWAAGNSLVRDSELSCNGPEGKAQPCTSNSGCSLSQDASAILTRSQVAKTDNILCLFYQQETKKVKGSRQKLSNSVVTLALRHVLFCPKKGGWAGATGGQFQPVVTWSDCQRNNYATIRYAILAIPGPQWLEVQVPTWVRRVMEVLVQRTHGRFLGWQTWSNSR